MLRPLLSQALRVLTRGGEEWAGFQRMGLFPGCGGYTHTTRVSILCEVCFVGDMLAC